MVIFGKSPSRLLILGLLAAVCVTGALGCRRPEEPDGVTVASVSDDELEWAWDAALSVLRKHDFRPSRQDRALGVIETLPTTSQHWSEFWRQDVADTYSLAHAALHTTQRKATVRFVRASDGWDVEVQIDVYRLSMPESQITSASSALQAFSGVLPTTEGRVFQDTRLQRHWVHLGRDAGLEARLLRRMIGRIESQM